MEESTQPLESSPETREDAAVAVPADDARLPVEIDLAGDEPDDEAEAPAGPERGPRVEAETDAAAETDAEVEADSDTDEGDGREEILADLSLDDRIEALLLAAARPLTEARLGALLGIPAKGAAAAIRRSVERLNEHYRATGRSFSVERTAGGLRVMTRPEFGPLMDRLHADRQQQKLSPAALETLAIVAYRQPVLRAEIEAVRGVASGEVLRGLMERRLVRITGRSDELGRPMLYGTTPQFLKTFGLGSLDDLPEVEGLERQRRRPAARPARAAPAAASESLEDGEDGAFDAAGAATAAGVAANHEPSDPAVADDERRLADAD